MHEQRFHVLTTKKPSAVYHLSKQIAKYASQEQSLQS